MKSTVEVPYLNGSSPAGSESGSSLLGSHLRHVALYHSCDASRLRAVYCLVIPASASALLVVQQAAAGAAKDVSVGVADRLWREVTGAAGEGVAAAVSVGREPLELKHIAITRHRAGQ